MCDPFDKLLCECVLFGRVGNAEGENFGNILNEIFGADIIIGGEAIEGIGLI